MGGFPVPQSPSKKKMMKNEDSIYHPKKKHLIAGDPDIEVVVEGRKIPGNSRKPKVVTLAEASTSDNDEECEPRKRRASPAPQAKGRRVSRPVIYSDDE